MQFFHGKYENPTRWPQHHRALWHYRVLLWTLWEIVMFVTIMQRTQKCSHRGEGPLSVLQHTFQPRSWLEFWITAFQLARREWVPSSKNPVCLERLSSGCRARKSCFLNVPSLLSWGWFLYSVHCSGEFYAIFLKSRRLFGRSAYLRIVERIEWSSIHLLQFIWNLHNSLGYQFIKLALESFGGSNCHLSCEF